MGIKYKVNEDFFSVWGSKMAYVLGYLYADGSIYKSERGSYVSVTSIDRDTISKIKRWLNSEHTVRVDKSSYSNNKLRYTLRIGNKKIYQDLVSLGLYPNKSLTVRLPLIPSEWFADFLRGYFDGDGCVSLYRTKGITKKLIIRKLSVIFTSGSMRFLEDLLMNLAKYLDLRQKKVYTSRRCYQLRFATHDSLTILYFMYKGSPYQLFLKRKFAIYLKYLKLKNMNLNMAQWRSS